MENIKKVVFNIELPIYMNINGKNTLINMNWYRNAHFQVLNKIKKDYHIIIWSKFIKNKTKIKGPYQIHYKYFYKSIVSDLTNVTSVIDKFLNDSLQELNIIENDNINFLKKITCEVGEQDKINPRLEIEIREI